MIIREFKQGINIEPLLETLNQKYQTSQHLDKISLFCTTKITENTNYFTWEHEFQGNILKNSNEI